MPQGSTAIAVSQRQGNADMLGQVSCAEQTGGGSSSVQPKFDNLSRIAYIFLRDISPMVGG